jgi:hypothetical protein
MIDHEAMRVTWTGHRAFWASTIQELPIGCRKAASFSYAYSSPNVSNCYKYNVCRAASALTTSPQRQYIDPEGLNADYIDRECNDIRDAGHSLLLKGKLNVLVEEVG